MERAGSRHRAALKHAEPRPRSQPVPPPYTKPRLTFGRVCLDARAMNGPGQILPRAAQRFGDRIALVAATRTLRYRELDEESDRVASALRARGLEPGQVVSLYAQN